MLSECSLEPGSLVSMGVMQAETGGRHAYVYVNFPAGILTLGGSVLFLGKVCRGLVLLKSKFTLD